MEHKRVIKITVVLLLVALYIVGCLLSDKKDDEGRKIVIARDRLSGEPLLWITEEQFLEDYNNKVNDPTLQELNKIKVGETFENLHRTCQVPPLFRL